MLMKHLAYIIERRIIMGFLANILAALGVGSANTGSQACIFFFADEPECPESLIK